VALGRIALETERDANLARGHFGYAVDLVLAALPPNGRATLPPDSPANRPAFEAVEGLVRSFETLGQPREAAEVRALGQSWRGSPGPGRNRPGR
jgi:hypothetical protein